MTKPSRFARLAGSAGLFARPAVAVVFGLAAATALVAVVARLLQRVIRPERSDRLQLAERETHFRELFAGVSESVALFEGVWNANGQMIDVRVLEANPAALEMFGLNPVVIGHSLGDFNCKVHPDYLRGSEPGFRGEPTNFEFYSPRVDRWFDVRLRPMADNRVVQISVDITDLKRVESRQAEQFDELNHRVKNNLAAVSGMLAIQARLADNPKVREHLDKAMARIQTIGEIHTSLYEVKSQKGVELAGYLVRLCERLSTSVVEPERVRIQVTAEPATVPTDRAVAIGLMVNELVTNATKYAYPPPTRGFIRVGLERTGGRLCLSVSDDGPGMKGSPVSSGLGMRLVRSLVQQNRGELELDEGPGLTVRIMLADDDAAAVATEDPAASL